MDSYLAILQKEIVPALGCTEPMSVALAVAKAAELAGRPVDHVSIRVSGNILKNAMNVGIPGTDMVGLGIATGLAAVMGCSASMLEVLRDVSAEDKARAQQMLAEDRVHISLADTKVLFYIEASCSNNQNTAIVRIEDTHTGFTSIRLNNKELLLAEGLPTQSNDSLPCDMDFRGIYRFAMDVDIAALTFLEAAVEMNERISREGLEEGSGAGIGKHLLAAYSGGSSTWDIALYAAACTAAASDARMAGSLLPVMTTAGSGNQGITATLPVSCVAHKLHSGSEATLRALALSQLVTVYVKRQIGMLSALCGCAVAASVGSACGITHLYGGNYQQVEATVINIVADISGMICDGAKASCALKISTAVSSAMQCAQLAMQGVVISHHDGIVCETADKTIRNLGQLANPGMVNTDKVILEMMLSKVGIPTIN